MPTKASEYMISGAPIFLYSSFDSAIAKSAIKYKWAYVVSTNNIEKIKSAIADLYYNKELRITLGKKAVEYAKDNFDATVVREQFRKCFNVE